MGGRRATSGGLRGGGGERDGGGGSGGLEEGGALTRLRERLGRAEGGSERRGREAPAPLSRRQLLGMRREELTRYRLAVSSSRTSRRAC